MTITQITTENGKLTLPERSKLVCLAVEASDVDDAVKAIITKQALHATYAWADAESAMEQVEFAQRALAGNIAWADDATASADTLARQARKVANFVREAETKLAHAIELWEAVR
jgi:hypothetical protein